MHKFLFSFYCSLWKTSSCLSCKFSYYWYCNDKFRYLISVKSKLFSKLFQSFFTFHSPSSRIKLKNLNKLCFVKFNTKFMHSNGLETCIKVWYHTPTLIKKSRLGPFIPDVLRIWKEPLWFSSKTESPIIQFR